MSMGAYGLHTFVAIPTMTAQAVTESAAYIQRYLCIGVRPGAWEAFLMIRLSVYMDIRAQMIRDSHTVSDSVLKIWQTVFSKWVMRKYSISQLASRIAAPAIIIAV